MAKVLARYDGGGGGFDDGDKRRIIAEMSQRMSKTMIKTVVSEKN